MLAAGVLHRSITLRSDARRAVDALSVDECTLDAPGLAIPRAESQLVVRWGPHALHGMDLHVMGPRRRARRKDLHRGQRAITARVRMGMHEAVFGVPSSAIAGRVLALGELWDARAVDQLTERMMAARDLASAARVLESALAEQQRAAQHRHAALVLAAVARLETLRVSEVADALAVSERHLRRVFREMIGMSPKEYARLTRFHRALRVARDRAGLDWAAVAASAGYYDQAHLIGDFREIAGVTPRALLRELRAAEPIQHSTVSA